MISKDYIITILLIILSIFIYRSAQIGGEIIKMQEDNKELRCVIEHLNFWQREYKDDIQALQKGNKIDGKANSFNYPDCYPGKYNYVGILRNK